MDECPKYCQLWQPLWSRALHIGFHGVIITEVQVSIPGVVNVDKRKRRKKSILKFRVWVFVVCTYGICS